MILKTKLLELHACEEAIEWAGDKSPKEVWNTCERGDWMLWLAGKLDVDGKLLVKAACACAREALVHVPDSESRPRIAIETAERWAEGKATAEEAKRAANAADAANTAHVTYFDVRATAAAYAANAAHAAHAANAADVGDIHLVRACNIWTKAAECHS